MDGVEMPSGTHKMGSSSYITTITIPNSVSYRSDASFPTNNVNAKNSHQLPETTVDKRLSRTETLINLKHFVPKTDNGHIYAW